MLKTLFYLLIICMYFNAHAQNENVDSSAITTLRIDPQTARGAAVSQVFDEVNFIPLETTKESLFGTISQLETAKDCFIIFDYDTKSILIFTQTGKFRTRIDGSKFEKEESEKLQQGFYGFKLAYENNEVLVKIQKGKFIYYFNFDGKRIRKETETENTGYAPTPFADSVTQFTQHFEVKKGNDSTSYEIALFKNKTDTALYFPYNANRYKEDQYFGDAIIDNGIPNEYFYLRSLDFNIYKVTPEKLSLTYRIILPANNSFPKDFMTNPIYKNKRFEYFNNNKQVYYSLTNTYKTGNHLFLKFRTMGFDRTKKDAIIYNLQTSEIISIADIEPDSLSYFLPVTDASYHYDFISRGFHLFKSGYLYTSYSSLAMFAFKEQSTAKKAVYNAALTNYFKTQSKTSNPILVVLKPKTD